MSNSREDSVIILNFQSAPRRRKHGSPPAPATPKPPAAQQRARCLLCSPCRSALQLAAKQCRRWLAAVLAGLHDAGQRATALTSLRAAVLRPAGPAHSRSCWPRAPGVGCTAAYPSRGACTGRVRGPIGPRRCSSHIGPRRCSTPTGPRRGSSPLLRGNISSRGHAAAPASLPLLASSPPACSSLRTLLARARSPTGPGRSPKHPSRWPPPPAGSLRAPGHSRLPRWPARIDPGRPRTRRSPRFARSRLVLAEGRSWTGDGSGCGAGLDLILC